MNFIISLDGQIMKCPKCGYVSFEYLDTCRKCGRDLTQLKTDMGVTTFTPGVINVLKYVEGMEEAVEEGEESAVATATAEETEEAGAAAVVEAVAVTSEEQSAKVETQEKGEIEISLPEDITEPKLDVAEVSPQPMAEDRKEEISLTIKEEPKIEETLSVEPEIKESPMEEITLSLEDIAELGGEKDKGKKKEGDETKLEIE